MKAYGRIETTDLLSRAVAFTLGRHPKAWPWDPRAALRCIDKLVDAKPEAWHDELT
jgi:hypothetical protein